MERMIRLFIDSDLADDLDFDRMENLATERTTPGLIRSQADLLWKIHFRGSERYLLLLIEFQSETYRYMSVRILYYIAIAYHSLVAARARRRKLAPGGLLPPALAVTIYNGRERWTAPDEVFDLIAPTRGWLASQQPRLRHEVLDLRALGAQGPTEGNLVSWMASMELDSSAANISRVVREVLAEYPGPQHARLREAFREWILGAAKTWGIEEKVLEQVRSLKEAGMIYAGVEELKERAHREGRATMACRQPALFTSGLEAGRREAASALDSKCYRNHEHLPAITSEVKIMDAPFSFNRSIRIGSRRDRITGDSGALTGRELLGRSGVVRFLAKRLPDKRDGRRIRHSQKRLARTLLLLAGQGRREHSDATELRDDPALRLATGDRAGTAPLGKGGRLPSQPTLSRRVAAWSAKEGVEVLREGLQRLAGWRLKAMGGWRRPKKLVIDIDSLPVEVHGEQPGSAWNGYYHRRVYHPIVAAVGETGDILDLRLREGQVHTADGGLEFVLEVLERAERHLCGKAAVRFDAGYPGEPLMAALEERGTHYVARVRNNAVLKRLALPAMDAVVWDALSNGVPAGEPRTWVCESSYRAGSWSRSRRVVQVVVERLGELIPRCFWLLTSMPSGEMSGEDLLALYRKRGKAEGHLGELMSVVAPALSSTSRRKSHYRGKEIRKREKGVDAFACNQVRLLLAGFGYQIMHVQRAVLERVTGTGWSLRRLAERVLRTPARFTVSGRRITMTTGGASAHWRMLARGLATLHGPSG